MHTKVISSHCASEKQPDLDRITQTDASGDVDKVVRISARAEAHNDQLKAKRDELHGKTGKDGKKIVAIGDEDNKLLCEHYPESQLQTVLMLKMLRCTCTWGFDDAGGIMLVFVSALFIMVFARECGDHRYHSARKRSAWTCSGATAFAVVNAIMSGLFRSNCFTWADVGLFYFCFGCCCVPWCYCTAVCFAEPPPVDSEGREVPLEIHEEEGLLCMKTGHEDQYGEPIYRTSSRELMQMEVQRHT